MNRPPLEPSARQRSLAIEMRQQFIAYVNEGFTDEQALQIIGMTITAGMIANPPTEGDSK